MNFSSTTVPGFRKVLTAPTLLLLVLASFELFQHFKGFFVPCSIPFQALVTTNNFGRVFNWNSYRNKLCPKAVTAKYLRFFVVVMEPSQGYFFMNFDKAILFYNVFLQKFGHELIWLWVWTDLAVSVNWFGCEYELIWLWVWHHGLINRGSATPLISVKR